MEFTNKTSIQLEPGGSEPIDLTAAGENYVTPPYFQPTLGDLARLQYTRATLATDLSASAANTGKATVRLMAGAVEIASVPLDFSAGQRLGQQIPVDLSQAAGSAPLAITVTVDAATAAGETAIVKAWLEVAHPLVISNC